jgi:hypothetical protein
MNESNDRKVLREIVANDPFNQSAAGVLARRALASADDTIDRIEKSHAALQAKCDALAEFANYVLELDPDSDAPMFARARAALAAYEASK